MKSKHVLPIQIESFALLVKRLKRIAKRPTLLSYGWTHVMGDFSRDPQLF